ELVSMLSTERLSSANGRTLRGESRPSRRNSCIAAPPVSGNRGAAGEWHHDREADRLCAIGGRSPGRERPPAHVAGTSANSLAGLRIKGQSGVTPERGYIAVTSQPESYALRFPSSKGLFQREHVYGSANPLEIVVPARYLPGRLRIRSHTCLPISSANSLSLLSCVRLPFLLARNITPGILRLSKKEHDIQKPCRQVALSTPRANSVREQTSPLGGVTHHDFGKQSADAMHLVVLGLVSDICIDQSLCDVRDPSDIRYKRDRIRVRYRAAPAGQAREPCRWCDRTP